MLSISGIRGNGKYFLDLARDDYYTSGGEPKGVWLGSAATHFALDGKRVQNDQLKQALDGFSPRDAKAKLVQNAGKTRQSGYDLTFNAPKSVSVVWAVAPDKMRKQIQSAQLEAVKEALKFIEENAIFTRRGKEGKDVESASALFAAFEHSTSRAQDPHLHTHCLLLNACLREDGTTGTLFSEVLRDEKGNVIETYNPVLLHKMAVGAIYRAELAYQLESRLGFHLEASDNGFSFDVKGIPSEASDFYSTRRKEIEAHLKEKGFQSPEAAEVANLATRITKDDISRPKLFEKWKGELREFGVDETLIKAITNKVIQSDKSEALDHAIEEAGKALADEQGSFALKELYESVANHVVANAVPAKNIAARIEHEVFQGHLVSLGWNRKERVLSTKENLQFEHAFVESLSRSKANDSHKVDDTVVSQVLRERAERGDFELSKEQTRALRYLVTGEHDGEHVGGLRVVTGDAGSGKTTLLREARIGWERAGYKVRGAALAGTAADNLEQETGVQSSTVSKWNYELRKSSVDTLKHHGRMLARALRKKHTWKEDSSHTLDSKTVLVIDETAMADSGKLYELHQAAEAAGALVCWVGDEKQCQAIGHGGAFVQATRMVDSIRLEENFRQQDAADKELARLQAEGKSAEAIRNLADRGRIHVASTEERAIERIVEDWTRKGGARNPKSHQVFCATHKQRLALNENLQWERINVLKRVLGGYATNHEGQKLFPGDRVNFRETISFFERDISLADQAKTEVKRAMGQAIEPKRERVRRGSFGTVVSLNPLRDSIRVSMDDGRLLDVPLSKEAKPNRSFFPTPKLLRKKERTRISLGYATTTHAGQGGTFDNVYVLAGGSMQTNELSYVQLTRGKFETHLYTTEGEGGTELALREALYNASSSGNTKDATALTKRLDATLKQKEHTIEGSLLAKRMADSEKKQFATTQYPIALGTDAAERER